MPDTRITEAASHYLRGLLMGGADVIPGVSGGTVALIVGIYERLVHCITLLYEALMALLRGDAAAARRRFSEVEWLLIIPLFAGIGTALIAGAAFIPGLLRAYPVQMRALFFGLILGSLSIPWNRMETRNRRSLLLSAAAAILAFFLVGLPVREPADPSLWVVFPMAAVAICAMILPGVSGAFLLLVLGIYEPTLEAVHDRDLLYVAVFGAGAAVGLGTFSGVLNWLLEHHHDMTMAALVGLMAGSLRALWPWLTVDRGLDLPSSGTDLIVPVVLVSAAFALVILLNRFGDSANRNAPDRSQATSQR